jgi:membrane protease YdiL (CAAX protease family)
MAITSAGPVGRDAPAEVGSAVGPGHDDRSLPGTSLAWFVVLSLLLTAGAALASGAMAAVVPFLLALGPGCIAVGLAMGESRAALRRLLSSLSIRPANRRWYLVLLVPVLWALAVAVVAVALGQPSQGLFEKLTPTALLVPLVVLVPAFAEELAWRGFALPRALASMSPLRASLLLAIPWTLMHLVLQLPGGVNASVSVWPTIVSIAAYSVVLSWVFFGTGGSVLISAMVHAGLNGVTPLMSGLNAETAWEIRAVVAAIIALTIVGLGGLRQPATRHDDPGSPA